jgi:hypothetical protein
LAVFSLDFGRLSWWPSFCVPIVLFEGKILDGRNRYNACKQAGVSPQYREFEGGNPWQYVWDHNGQRRNLSGEQRAALFLEFEAGWTAEEQKVAEAADAARSKAAKERPRTEGGTFEASLAIFLNFGISRRCRGVT